MEYEGSSDRGPRRFGGRPRRSGFRERPEPVPVKEGEEYKVTVGAIGRREDGIARIENFVVFVPGAKIGDHFKVKITGVGGGFATASIVT